MSANARRVKRRAELAGQLRDAKRGALGPSDKARGFPRTYRQYCPNRSWMRDSSARAIL